MGSVSGNWKAVVQGNIDSSERTLKRIREQQLNYEAARKALTATLDVPRKSVLDMPVGSSKFSALLEDKVNCLYSQVKNCMTELETERTLRCDGLRDMQRQLSIREGELKAMFQQLKKENEYTAEVVKSLEKRFLLSSSMPPAGCAAFGVDATGGSTIITAAGVIPSDIGKRVEELESTVTRQRRMMEDRQSLLDGIIREMVGVKIDTEVERMRSVARDAARESVEDIIRLRLAAMQEMFNDELQRVMRSTGVSSEVAQTTERLFRQMEQDVQRRLQELNSAVDLVSSGMRQQEAALVDMEGRIMQKVLAANKQEMEALRREMLDVAAKNAQSSDAAKIAMEATVNDAVAAACLDFAKKEDIAAAVVKWQCESEQQCAAMYERFSVAKKTNDTVAAEHNKHVALLEERLGSLQVAMDEIKRQVANSNQFLEGAKNEMEQWKPRVREALTASKEARTVAEQSIACVQKMEDLSREELARSGVELQRLLQEQAAAATQLRQLNEKMTAAEARHATVSVTVNELSDRVSETLPPLSAKVDSVQRTLQEVGMPKIEGLTQSLREQQALYDQLQTDVSLIAKTDARQTSDIRRELRTGLQTVEDRVLQELHDWQQESSVALSGLRTTVDGLRTAVKTQEKLFARKDALDGIEEGLADRLALVEGKIETVLQRAAKKEQMTAPALPVAMHTMASEVQKDMDRQVEELRQLVDGVRQSSARQLSDVQKTFDRKIKEEAERVTQEFSDMRDENLLQGQKLLKTVSELAEDYFCRVEKTSSSCTNYLQTCVNEFKNAFKPKQLVFAICSDQRLLDELTGALHGVFSLRTETAEAMTRVQQKNQQLLSRIDEVCATNETYKREVEEQLQAYELSHRRHAERLALLDSRQGTFVELSKQWCDEGLKECKKDIDFFSSRFDDSVAAIRNVATNLELQTRTLQFSLQELQEEQTALKKRFTELQAAQQSAMTLVSMHCSDKMRRNDDYYSDGDSGASNSINDNDVDDDNKNNNNDDNAGWKTRVEERVASLEAKTEATAECTADALDGLRGGIEKCVTLFAQQAASVELPNDSPTSGELTGLDDVLLFLLHHLCHVHNTVQTVCGGALGTLDLVQHHEAQLALLPPLRSLAVRCAGHIARIAKSVGLQLDVSVDSLLATDCEEAARKNDVIVDLSAVLPAS